MAEDNKSRKNIIEDTDNETDDDYVVSSSFSWKPWIIRGGVTIVIIIALMITYIVGSISGASKADPTRPRQIEDIKSQNKVLDSLESLKDSQVRSLTKDVNEYTSESGSPSTKEATQAAADSAEPVNSFIEKFYALGYNASPDEVNATASDLSGNLAADAASSADKPDESLGQQVVQGNSPAKDVKATGKKAARSELFLAGDDGESKVFVVLTPFATETDLYQTVSVVKTSGQKVSGYVYGGIIQGDPKVVDDALARMKNAKKD